MSKNCVSDNAQVKVTNKMWCDDCGRKVYVSRVRWKAAPQRCKACGCSRLVETRPERFNGKPE